MWIYKNVWGKSIIAYLSCVKQVRAINGFSKLEEHVDERQQQTSLLK